MRPRSLLLAPLAALSLPTSVSRSPVGKHERREIPGGLSEVERQARRLKEQMHIDDAKRFVENARFESSLVQERLREGFHMRFGCMVYGRWREDERPFSTIRSEPLFCLRRLPD